MIRGVIEYILLLVGWEKGGKFDKRGSGIYSIACYMGVVESILLPFGLDCGYPMLRPPVKNGR